MMSGGRLCAFQISFEGQRREGKRFLGQVEPERRLKGRGEEKNQNKNQNQNPSEERCLISNSYLAF